MSKATVRAGWLLRTAPSIITGKVVGSTRANDGTVEVIQRGNGWSKVAVWISDQGVTHITDPTPPTNGRRFRVGLNVLYDAATAQAEAQRGCKYFLVMNAFAAGEAIAVQHPDARVILRKYITSDFFISDAQAEQALEGMRHRNVTYMLYNENDQGGCDGAPLIERATQDVRLARYLKKINPSARYAAGTFSNGTPDFNNPETCRIIKDIYAPAYNAGEIDFDMHLYTPEVGRFNEASAGEWQWFERRFEFLFTRCGFDPTIGNIHSSEWGLDIRGSGGYRQNAYRIPSIPDMVGAHAAVCQRDMIIDGRRYPTPLIGGAIFIAGENADPRWRNGYDVRPWLDGIRKYY